MRSKHIVANAEASGPGFVNLVVRDDALWENLRLRLQSPRLGIPNRENGRRTVIDYSSPNIAKEMHVGHLRTTVLGDCLVPVLQFLAADVVRQNHLGDWGSQFGMLIQYLDENPDRPWRAADLSSADSPISALDNIYQDARANFGRDAGFAARARSRVVELQRGDPQTLAQWREIVDESEQQFRKVYERLDVLLTPQDSFGESEYNTQLADVVAELTAAGVAEESEGAVVVLSERFTAPDGRPVPLILQKSDGGYGYDATDLAAIRYRTKVLHAQHLIYVTDSRQSTHFQMIFDAARRVGWLDDTVSAEHVGYGAVLSRDGRPFKTREGGTVRLADLIDDAVRHSKSLIENRGIAAEGTDLDQLAWQIGIGAIKYADLSTSREKDYVFDLDRMVSLDGNTGMYLQYAHARICSILRRAGNSPDDLTFPLPFDPEERALALTVDAYPDVVLEVGRTLEPHRLCAYLYRLARDFTNFYDKCNVLNSPFDIRMNRLALCRLVAHTLSEGLRLLGVPAPERV